MLVVLCCLFSVQGKLITDKSPWPDEWIPLLRTELSKGKARNSHECKFGGIHDAIMFKWGFPLKFQCHHH